MRALPAIWLVALCSCGGPAPDGVLDVVFDPCEPVVLHAPGATAAQLASIDEALLMWSAHGVDGPRRAGSPADESRPRLEVRFETAAPAFNGLYDDELGVIYVNATLADDRERAITVAHELGHALGLWHIGDRPSVMNPANLQVAPNDGDQLAIEELWGVCGRLTPASPPRR